MTSECRCSRENLVVGKVIKLDIRGRTDEADFNCLGSNAGSAGITGGSSGGSSKGGRGGGRVAFLFFVSRFGGAGAEDLAVDKNDGRTNREVDFDDFGVVLLEVLGRDLVNTLDEGVDEVEEIGNRDGTVGERNFCDTEFASTEVDLLELDFNDSAGELTISVKMGIEGDDGGGSFEANSVCSIDGLEDASMRGTDVSSEKSC